MADTTTTNYGWIKPEPGGSLNTWGPKLNANASDMDTVVFGKIDKAGGNMTGALKLASGSLSAPGLGFVADVDTGLYLIASGQLGVVVNGELIGTLTELSPGGWTLTKVRHTDALIGMVALVEHYKAVAVQTSSSEGGVDFYTRTANALAKFISLLSGKMGVNVAVPLLTMDISGGVCVNMVDVAGGTSIDCRAGTVFKKTITVPWTPTFDNVPAGRVYGFELKITNGNTAAITWPASVKWPAATSPLLTTTGRDRLYFETDDSGATWDGRLIGKGFA